jgi:hypothetical protein
MSRETDALIQYLRDSTVPFQVTSINTGGHAPHSRHFQVGTGGIGLAVDLAGPVGQATDRRAMRAGFEALFRVPEQLHELIYEGPEFCVHAGRKVNGVAVYGQTTMNAHRNHVHVSVDKGRFVRWPGDNGAVAGPGPLRVTEVLHHDFPGGEDMLVRHDYDVAKLDERGNGWLELDLRPDQVVSLVVNGSYPPADGYWNLPVLGRQDRAGKTVVTITEGPPSSPLRFSVWALA